MVGPLGITVPEESVEPMDWNIDDPIPFEVVRAEDLLDQDSEEEDNS